MIELTPEQVALLIGTFALVVTGLVLSRFQIAGLRDKLSVEDPQTPEKPNRSSGKIHPTLPWPPPPTGPPSRTVTDKGRPPKRTSPYDSYAWWHRLRESLKSQSR